MGGGILARAFVQAYRQALASKSFVEISAREGIQYLFEAKNYFKKVNFASDPVFFAKLFVL